MAVKRRKAKRTTTRRAGRPRTKESTVRKLRSAARSRRRNRLGQFV